MLRGFPPFVWALGFRGSGLAWGQRSPHCSPRGACRSPWWALVCSLSLSLSLTLSLSLSLLCFALLGVWTASSPCGPRSGAMPSTILCGRARTLHGLSQLTANEKACARGMQKRALIHGPARQLWLSTCVVSGKKLCVPPVPRLTGGCSPEGRPLNTILLSRMVRGKSSLAILAVRRFAAKGWFPAGRVPILCKYLHFSKIAEPSPPLYFRSVLRVSVLLVPSFFAFSSIWVATLSTCCARLRCRGGPLGSATLVDPGTGVCIAGRVSSAAVNIPEARAAPA